MELISQTTNEELFLGPPVFYLDSYVEDDYSKEEAIDNMAYMTDYYSIYYGKLPVMVTSGLRDTTGILKDDKGYAFKSVKCDGLCYNVIFGDRPQSLHGYNLKRMYSFSDAERNQALLLLSQEYDEMWEKIFEDF